MDSEEGEEQQEELAAQLPEVTEPFISALSALEEHPSSQVSGDTNLKQPRTLSTIDDVLVGKTQPEPEEELEDNFDYDHAEEPVLEEIEEVEEMEEMEEMEEIEGVEEAEEVPSAQQSVPDTIDSLETLETLGEDKENSPSKENERYVRQVVSQLPISKIKRIMKMDPETKLIQNDSVLLVAFATELFIKALSTASAR